ncbi:hypothetical protein MUP35_01745 [Patescibacteria group bacterium]|nr:hypothetical protein [Patescibacteria group bacterium]
MDKERNKNQNYSEKPFNGREELVDGIFDKEIEWFVYVPWGLLYQELVPLQREGKITGLHYKIEKDAPDEFTVRFFITDKIKGPELINIVNDFLPSEQEEKSKKGWTSWAKEEARLRKEHSKKLEKDLKKLHKIVKNKIFARTSV